MTDRRTRKSILARRAKFLAAALVATLPACDREKEGIEPDHPTTKTEPVDAAAPTKPPAPDAAMAMPCLEVMPLASSADAGPKPMPCLKIVPRDAGGAPHPCLKVSADD